MAIHRILGRIKRVVGVHDFIIIFLSRLIINYSDSHQLFSYIKISPLRIPFQFKLNSSFYKLTIVKINPNFSTLRMSSKPSDEQLRQAIDAIFNKYDADNSGTLEDKEIFCLISDAFKSLGRNKEVGAQQVTQFIAAIDKNGDGKIAKP